ncbi:MAG TPA: alpha/beta fold hydrolase [Acidimicrobiales bacterium]|nr:alpha/beta fold hydrolase [Acidimicrobiales bacterium]
MDRVDVGKVTICFDLLGRDGDPVFVLIAGLSRQLIGWDDAFCGLLVDRGFRVLRFDNRDAGLSTSIEGGPPFDLAAARRGGRAAVAYALEDMADDAAGLLDALDIAGAHVAGTSMGGMIGQTLAIRHPTRVLSLCSIMSMTGADDVGRPTPEAMAVLMKRPPRSREEYLDTELANQRIIGSKGALVDEAWRRQRFERFYDRGLNPEGTARQMMAIVASGDRTAALSSVHVPTLVIHGDADTLVPLDGGEATARAIPGARLMVVPDMGHELPPAVWAEVVDAMVANATATGRDSR